MDESIEVEKPFLHSETADSLKEVSMSKETICEPRPCGPTLYLQCFPLFEFPQLE
jgi:hypothetical protein